MAEVIIKVTDTDALFGDTSAQLKAQKAANDSARSLPSPSRSLLLPPFFSRVSHLLPSDAMLTPGGNHINHLVPTFSLSSSS